MKIWLTLCHLVWLLQVEAVADLLRQDLSDVRSLSAFFIAVIRKLKAAPAAAAAHSARVGRNVGSRRCQNERAGDYVSSLPNRPNNSRQPQYDDSGYGGLLQSGHRSDSGSYAHNANGRHGGYLSDAVSQGRSGYHGTASDPAWPATSSGRAEYSRSEYRGGADGSGSLAPPSVQRHGSGTGYGNAYAPATPPATSEPYDSARRSTLGSSTSSFAGGSGLPEGLPPGVGPAAGSMRPPPMSSAVPESPHQRRHYGAKQVCSRPTSLKLSSSVVGSSSAISLLQLLKNWDTCSPFVQRPPQKVCYSVAIQISSSASSALERRGFAPDN